MEPHYHVWVRSGRIMTMLAKVYRTQPAAWKAGRKLREPADFMVRKCEDCPTSTPSRRGPDHRARRQAIVAALAEDLDAAPAAVRRALARGEREAKQARWSRESAPTLPGMARTDERPEPESGAFAEP
ncbi:MAG: hypothetical protein OXG38_07670 [Chloroflexi bacterium]|nr:hypothetical protein [Chloroflexota bacterium]